MELNKTGFVIIAITTMMGWCVACNNNTNENDDVELKKESAVSQGESEPIGTLDEVVVDDEMLSVQSSLNDIRFANFKTRKDWLNNEYILTMCRYLNDYRAGRVKNEELDPYKKGLNSQFVIYDTEPFIMGGLYVQLIFLDMPDKLFTGWVYSYVDETTKTVTGYEYRSLILQEENGEFTKETLLQAVEEVPDLKLW